MTDKKRVTKPVRGGKAVNQEADRKAPPSYSPDVAQAILDDISTGMSLRKACEKPGRPSEAVVRYWRTNDIDGFAAKMKEARRNQADSRFDQAIELVDDVVKPTGIDPARARVAADMIKWATAKLHPEVYGDKLEITGNALSGKSDDDLRKRAEELLSESAQS